MKRISPVAALAAAFALALGLAGCGSGPADRLKGYLDSLRNADAKSAASYCYDDVSSRDMAKGLEGQLYGTEITVLSVDECGQRSVRRKGYRIKKVASVKERMAGPLAEIEQRFKPLIDQANAVLSNAQAEYNNAVEMKKYAAVTYGTNMPQYYAEQVRINNALPRVRNAQAAVDRLNTAKQNEIDALEAGAEAGYRQDKSDSDKALARNSCRLPAFEVKVKLVQGGSAQRRTFTLVEDGDWEVYSVDSGD